MGALSKRFPDARRMEHGMRVDLEGGSVWVAPAGNQEALRLAAEGPEAEIAGNCATLWPGRPASGIGCEFLWYTFCG